MTFNMRPAKHGLPESDVDVGQDRGGTIVAAGTPEDTAKAKESYTGQYLKPVLARKPKAATKKAAAE
jgi:excinuclease ABC subunit A